MTASVAEELAKARHGMGVLWGEITDGRTIAIEIAEKFQALRDEAAAFAEKVKHLMSVHDDVKELLAEISADVDTLAGMKSDSDAANADLKTDATSLRDKIKALIEPAPSVTSVGALGS